MVSSILLILLQYNGVVNPDVSLGFWKWYIAGVIVELILAIVGAKLLDKRDLRTDYGEKKDVKDND